MVYFEQFKPGGLRIRLEENGTRLRPWYFNKMVTQNTLRTYVADIYVCPKYREEEDIEIKVANHSQQIIILIQNNNFLFLLHYIFNEGNPQNYFE